MDEQLPAADAPTDRGHADADRCCAADGGDQPEPLPWWLRGLLATASAMTGALVPAFDEPRERWSCPFCAWDAA